MSKQRATAEPEAPAPPDAPKEPDAPADGAGTTAVATVDEETGEIANPSGWTNIDPAALVSMSGQDVINMLATLGEDDVIDVRTLTHTISVEQKDKLIGRPFVVLAYRHNESDQNPAGFWSMILGTMDTGEILVVNDGGKGIPPVLEEATNAGAPMIKCAKGFRRSDYKALPPTAERPNGRPAGTTYYFG